MKRFRKADIITGWIVFALAAMVYLLTMDPATSLWDCGEFIATAAKLQVGHPPGAPLFMIMGRIFTLFGGGANASAAMMMNAMSALASAFTVMFLFWIIVFFAKKIIIPDNRFSIDKTIAVIGSGAVGALAFTFSDTFWFSAVEAEVYATSSLFTAVVFWAILKWEQHPDSPYANRWIVLIAYLIGLSIGVHLLNLLAIPAIVFVYYYKKYKPTPRGVLFAFFISVALLGIMMYGIIHGFVKLASWSELFFVNALGMPFHSGLIIYILLIIVLIIWGIRYSIRNQKPGLNLIITCFMVILLGYSSYAMIMIRSNADPPVDENNPENIFALKSYLNREQYGDRPLFHGQYFNAP